MFKEFWQTSLREWVSLIWAFSKVISRLTSKGDIPKTFVTMYFLQQWRISVFIIFQESLTKNWKCEIFGVQLEYNPLKNASQNKNLTLINKHRISRQLTIYVLFCVQSNRKEWAEQIYCLLFRKICHVINKSHFELLVYFQHLAPTSPLRE
jgi:hypothetical protein